jgi:hypothetical protein
MARSGKALDREQYQRFLDTAREHGCEENVGRLDEVVRLVAKLSPHRRDQEGDRKPEKTQPKGGTRISRLAAADSCW